jgi:saccharopine dehydrogenase-like NADP-dependent oxidoreductase
VQTMLRGTLRRPGYCGAWQVLVSLGLTDDTQPLSNAATLPWQTLVASRLLQPAAPAEAATQLVAQLHLDPHGPELERLAWLGIFSEQPVGLANATPAQLLEHLLIEKWALGPHDRDQVVMQHQFAYELQGKQRRRIASLVVTGTDATHTAMAQTVGLPLGMAVRRIARGEVVGRGVVIPTTPDLYEPILAELAADYGLAFQEEDSAH